MKNYDRIIAKLFEPLLLTPQHHAVFCQILEARLSGQMAEVSGAKGQVPGEDSEDDNETEQRGDTVIIPVHGTIVRSASDLAMSQCGCPLEDLDEKIDAVEADPRVKRVIYHFDTPGGVITGVPETGRKILRSQKETIAFTDSQCCSAGLWLAAQCQRFYATQSSRVGSVGVYTMALDLSAALKKEGVKVNAIFAGKYKLLGAHWKPLADEERAIMQAGVDKIYGQFKAAMLSHRKVEDADFGNGLVFDGDVAAEKGFTDGVVENLREVLEGLV